MSVTLFLAICILGIDFMVYALFEWSYGDKRKAIARQVAAHRNVAGEKPRGPFLVASRAGDPGKQESHGIRDEQTSKSEPRELVLRDSYKQRLA
jgi:hypothetical protein